MNTPRNHLQNETSPYLLEHAGNPVDWYPWGEEAFRRAREEDKPVFLSIGYSTCHWCHVMARESFEDPETAALINRYFVAVKVDREERPDIDSIYMAVCQAFTGSGGWPTSIFMTAEQEPFFAGTYFPRTSRGGMPGLREVLTLIHGQWEQNRPALLGQAKEMVAQLRRQDTAEEASGEELPERAAALYKRAYDPENGGFGMAPKFPSPHNLLFLLAYYERRGDTACLEMAEHTLTQMYRGGLFDHIGFGFCRYSTDARFLAPHFEKMLYDNALLILAFCRACEITNRELYRLAAKRTADFVLREMTSPAGGFYSAQDADSGGEEGKYYLFTPEETVRLLGKEDGQAFNRHFDIDAAGNFGRKSIPNLLHSDPEERSFDRFLPPVYEYRRRRCPLRTDDKILTAWNALMTAALCRLYQDSGESAYLEAAQRADRFTWENLCTDGVLHVSYRAGKRGVRGFLDDYAACLFAQLALYRATLERTYLKKAERLCQEALSRFADRENGGFYLYGEGNEALILRPKETWDGALPSGNSLMAWNLVRLSRITGKEVYEREAGHQLEFLAAHASPYPTGYAMTLLSLLESREPSEQVTVVPAGGEDMGKLALALPPEGTVRVVDPSGEYPLKEGRTTFYICRGNVCLPPVNDPSGI